MRAARIDTSATLRRNDAMKILARAIVALALPILVFMSGASLMSRWTDRQLVRERLNRDFPGDSRPLNMRFGYDVETARAHWSSLDPEMRESEMRFLELDLVFPLVYGAGLAIGLLLMWATAGRPVNPAVLIALVGVTILADWTENLIHIQQLRHVIAGQQLDAGVIAIASAATIVKLLFFSAASFTIVLLTIFAVYRTLVGRQS